MLQRRGEGPRSGTWAGSWSSHARVELGLAVAGLARFTSARVGLAYEILGKGDPTVLVIPGLVSHIDYDLSRPEIRSFYQRLADRHRLIRYDKRGCGLSDRTAEASALGLEV